MFVSEEQESNEKAVKSSTSTSSSTPWGTPAVARRVLWKIVK